MNKGMIVTAATFALMQSMGLPTHGVRVIERPKRFSKVDLTNDAKQPVKSSFGSKQRKRKARRKHRCINTR